MAVRTLSVAFLLSNKYPLSSHYYEGVPSRFNETGAADTGYLIEIDGDDIIWIGERYIKQ